MFEGKYVMWGAEHSMFSRKLQAMLNYVGVDFDFCLKSEEKGAEIEARVGTHFIPALQTPEGWFIHDSTPIGLLLNAKYPDRPIIPSSPVQKIASHLLEDWADEWFGRYAICSRWCYPDNVTAIADAFYATRIGKFADEALTEEESLQASEMINMVRDQFGLRACANRGCGVDQAEAVKADFKVLMAMAQEHFASHTFLLGDRACLGDFSFVGLFKAHIEPDPEPRSWIEECAPRMLGFMNNNFMASSGSENYLADDALPDSLEPLFAHMRDSYHKFLIVSKKALDAGDKWCEVDLGEGPVAMRSLKYSEISRLHIKREIESLSAGDRALVDKSLGSLGVLDAYLI